MVETPRRKRTFRRPSVIPGFGLSFGYTLTCLGSSCCCRWPGSS